MNLAAISIHSETFIYHRLLTATRCMWNRPPLYEEEDA
jgi:hypothetical protein